MKPPVIVLLKSTNNAKMELSGHESHATLFPSIPSLNRVNLRGPRFLYPEFAFQGWGLRIGARHYLELIGYLVCIYLLIFARMRGM